MQYAPTGDRVERVANSTFWIPDSGFQIPTFHKPYRLAGS